MTKLRSWGLAAAPFVGALGLAWIFHGHRPLQGWLLWRYLAYASIAAAFGFACLAAGTRLLALLLPGEAPPGGETDDAVPNGDAAGIVSEDDTIAFALGLLMAAATMFVLGLCGMMGTRGFVLVALALIWLGGPSALGLFARVRAWWSRPTVWTTGDLLLLLAGGVACVAIYLPILSPANTSYDARWYHLGLAEHDAALGAIRPHPEGVVQATISHVPILLYTWCFLLPRASLFDRLGLAAHLELVCFVMTLASLPPLVRRVLPSASPRLAWVAFFLFPAIFQYDTTLVSGADHIAAVFAIPILLVTWRVYERGELRAYALWAILVGGLFVTKYSAMIAVVGPALVVGSRLVRDAIAAREAKGALQRSAILAGCLLAATTPVWLRNLIFYGDPLYPLLHRFFDGHPWGVDAPAVVAAFRAESFVPRGTWLEQLRGVGLALVNHSFALYNWSSFHGRWPVFGSLCSASLLFLPFLRGTRRIWSLVAAAHLAIPAWFFLGPQERYLQIVVPWMVAAVACAAIVIWQQGNTLARAGFVALVGIQVAWSADVYFWPVHTMTGTAGIASTVELLGAAYRGEDVTKRSLFEPWTDIASELPRGAHVLAHHEHVRLGIGAPTVADAFPHQLGLSYGRLGGVQAVNAHLRAMGVTHVVWQADLLHRDEALASEILFHDWVSRLPSPATFGGYRLAELPPTITRPSSEAVAIVPCAGQSKWAPGVYRLGDLAAVPPPHVPEQDPGDWVPPNVVPAPLPPVLGAVDAYLLRDPACGKAPRGRVKLGAAEGWELWGPPVVP